MCRQQVRWLIRDNESWGRTGRHGSTGVMTAWAAFVANRQRLIEPTALAAGSSGLPDLPKLICIDLQPYQTVQACERIDILYIGGFSESLFGRVSAFLAENNRRFVSEFEATEL